MRVLSTVRRKIRHSGTRAPVAREPEIQMQTPRTFLDSGFAALAAPRNDGVQANCFHTGTHGTVMGTRRHARTLNRRKIRHSGTRARVAREPGIQMQTPRTFLDSGSPHSRRPGMTACKRTAFISGRMAHAHAPACAYSQPSAAKFVIPGHAPLWRVNPNPDADTAHVSGFRVRRIRGAPNDGVQSNCFHTGTHGSHAAIGVAGVVRASHTAISLWRRMNILPESPVCSMFPSGRCCRPPRRQSLKPGPYGARFFRAAKSTNCD